MISVAARAGDADATTSMARNRKSFKAHFTDQSLSAAATAIKSVAPALIEVRDRGFNPPRSAVASHN